VPVHTPGGSQTEKKFEYHLDQYPNQLTTSFVAVLPEFGRQVDGAFDDDLGWVGQRVVHIGFPSICCTGMLATMFHHSPYWTPSGPNSSPIAICRASRG
jgi:hypothetical protein